MPLTKKDTVLKKVKADGIFKSSLLCIYLRLASVRQLTPASLQGLHAVADVDLGGCYPP